MEILIPTFVHPHLFWVFDKKKHKDVKNIERDLKSIYTHTFSPSKRQFEPNDIAAILVDEIFRRFEVKKIVRAEYSSKISYQGWLIDYGYMVHTDHLYELPKEFQSKKALVQQAALKDVTYVLQKLDLASQEIKFIPTDVPTLAARVQSSLLIKKAKTLRLQVDSEVNGILLGDVIIINDTGGIDSLTRTLVDDKQLLIHNERMFKRIFDNLNIYIRTHLDTIYQISEHTRISSPEPKDTPKIVCGIDISTLGDDVLLDPKMDDLSASRKKHLIQRNMLKSPKDEALDSLDGSKSAVSDSSQERIMNESCESSHNELIFNKARNTDKIDTCDEIGSKAKSNLDNTKSVSSNSSQEIIIDKSWESTQTLDSSNNTKKSNTPNVTQTFDDCSEIKVANRSKRAIALLKLSKHALKSKTVGNGNANKIEILIDTKKDNTKAEESVNKENNEGTIKLKLSSEVQNQVMQNNNKTSSESSRKSLIEYMKRKKKLSSGSERREEGLVDSFEATSADDNSCFSDVQFENTSSLEWSFNEAEEPNSSQPILKHSPRRKKSSLPKGAVILPAGASMNLSKRKTRVAKVNNNVHDNFQEDTQSETNKIHRSNNLKEESQEIKNDIHIRDKFKESSPESESDTPRVAFKIDHTETTTENESKSSEDTELKFDEIKNEEQGEGCHLSNHAMLSVSCKCKNCVFWTLSDDWDQPLGFKDTENNKNLPEPIMRPPLLLKRENHEEKHENKILSLNFSKMSKMQKLYAAKLLVHGESIPVPVENVADINIHKDIHENIYRMNYVKAKRIQTYAWPALTRNQHVVMIGESGTGKTMAYLPVLSSFVHERNDRYSQLFNMGGGPFVVILCNTSDKCEEIFKTSKLILNRLKVRVQLMTYPNDLTNLNPIDILVTMPTVLESLLKSRKINFKRLCHFVVEEAYYISKNHTQLLNNFLTHIQQVLLTRTCAKTVQLIICSEHWTTQIQNICKKLDKTPFVCIANYLEAALYGKMQLTMKFLNTALKEQEIRNLLSNTFNYKRTIIICNEDEIEDIQTILMLKGIEYSAIKADMDKETMFYLEEVWSSSKPGDHTVLVCSDFIFESMLTVTSASLLIHYSLPTTWTAFRKRFSSLLKNCSSPLNSSEDQNEIQSVVFIDEHSESVMYRFSNFLKVSGLHHQLSDPIKEYFKNLQEKMEHEKVAKRVELCKNLKIMGACTVYGCDKRHILDESLDIKGSILPKNGKIKFQICEMSNVTTYTIRILEHYDLDNKLVEKFEDQTAAINNKLMEYSKKILKEPLSTPVVNHLYSYLDNNTKYFYRCRVLSIGKSAVRVKLIDKGTTLSTVNSNLFRLPKDLKGISEQTYEVYLANLIPPHQDADFSAKSSNLVQFVYDKLGLSKMTLSAKIHLQLGNNLWLKYVEEERDLFDKTLPNCGFQLNREIADQNYAVKSDKQLECLYKLCEKAEIELPVYAVFKPKVVKEVAQVTPQWAFFDMEKINEVTFSSAVSPDEFYVKLTIYNAQLEQLQKDILADINRPFYPEAGVISVGKCYTTKLPEDNFYSRVIVRQIENDQALCFFVDYGDELIVNFSNLKHINNDFLSRLPFQSIQCRLYGVQTVNNNGQWSSESTSILYEYSLEPDSDIFRSLYIKPCQKEDNAINQGQKRYAVLLKDGFGAKRIINQIMIDCGFGLPSEELIEDFELPKVECQEHDGSDDEELEVIDTAKEDEGFDEDGNLVPFDIGMAGLEGFELNILDTAGFLDNITDFFKDESDKHSTPVKCPKETNNTASNDRDLPPIKAAPAVDYFTPEVLWSQTDDVVKLTLKITDVKEYETEVLKNRLFIFRTVTNGKKYQVKLMLYEMVDRTFQHTSIGPRVRITLNKQRKSIEWPRLVVTKEKLRNIHYDTEAIHIPEEKKRPFLQLPLEDDDDDSSDSDDDGRFVYEYSDLDSEYDDDIANCD